MALTHAGALSTPAGAIGLLQHPCDNNPSITLCACIGNRRPVPSQSSSRHTILSRGAFLGEGRFRGLTTPPTVRLSRSRNRSRVVQASIGETGTTDNATSSETEVKPGPKERFIEIDPFEIPKASPLQTAASVALTSLIGVLLFRSVRRRAKRATGVRVRSDREETVDLLAEAKANSLDSVNPNVPSLPASKEDDQAQKKNPLSVLSGAVVAGVIAAGLWLFTTKVEAVFDAQRLSTDYQIRQISITIRTIVVGLAYLSTFVFAFNSVGLVLYAGQLAFGLDDDATKGTSKSEGLATDKSKQEK